MTSHEMRNPLSAVIQCADSSIDGINQIWKLISQILPDKLNESLRKIQEEIGTCLDALQTILSCSLHQKRVIDDILTLSKLDSKLLLITPIRVKPAAVVAEAVKMFEIECLNENIKLDFFEDPSLSSTGADWVMMDPSRVRQVRMVTFYGSIYELTASRFSSPFLQTLSSFLAAVWLRGSQSALALPQQYYPKSGMASHSPPLVRFHRTSSTTKSGETARRFIFGLQCKTPVVA